jgi:hypothetical protein
MKKKLLTKSVVMASVFGLTMITGIASANSNDLKFYVGTGLDYIKYRAIQNASTHGVGIWAPVLGAKFCDTFGLEAGYSFNKTFIREANRLLKVNNGYVDVMGFMPILNQIDAIAGLGIGRLMVKKKTAMPVEIKNKFNWRAKLGLEYSINNNFGLRALFTYQNVQNKIKDSTSEDTLIKNMKSFGLSAIWTF